MCSLVLLAQRWCWLSWHSSLYPDSIISLLEFGGPPLPSCDMLQPVPSPGSLYPSVLELFISLVISPLSISPLSTTPLIWTSPVLTVVSFSSPCSLLSLPLSLHHSSGHFAKLCFSTSPLNFVFISTIVFLTGKRLFRHSESFYCNCAWFTPSYLCENINCSALYNRLAFSPLEVLPSASTFLLFCLSNQLFILFHNK